MRKLAITTEAAPGAVGAYSQAIQAGGFVFLSGQVPIDPATGQLVPSDEAGVQAQQVMRNLAAVLEAAGLGFDSVVKATIYLTDIADFQAVNRVYAAALGEGVKPARAAVAVAALPLGAKVEIEMTALA